MMSKKIKFLPIWAAVAAVILIAGVVLMAVLGFNASAALPENKAVEVGYNIVVSNSDELTGKLDEVCESAFEANGVRVLKEEKGTGMSSSQDWTVNRYLFDANVSDETLEKVKTAIEGKLPEAITNANGSAEVRVDIHTNSAFSFNEPVWRGAVAVAVGAIAALIYLGIRFGVGCALTGLVSAAAGGVLPVCLVAITRIPVYAEAPMFYAAIGAFVAVLLWMLQCMKLRELKKNSPRPLGAEEAVEVAFRGALPATVAFGASVAAVLLVVGAVATAGVRMLVLPALLSVVCAGFASLLLAPALHVPVRAAFEKLAARRKPRYAGKKANAKTEE